MRVRFGSAIASPYPPEAVAELNAVMDRVAYPVNGAIARLLEQTNGYSMVQLIVFGPILGMAVQAPEEVRRGIRSAINTFYTRMKQLHAARADVISGKLSLNKWVGAVTVVLDGVQGLGRDLKETTIINLAVHQYRQAAQDASNLWDRLSRLAAGVGEGAKIGLPLLGVAAILAAIFVVPRLLGGTTVVVERR